MRAQRGKVGGAALAADDRLNSFDAHGCNIAKIMNAIFAAKPDQSLATNTEIELGADLDELTSAR